MPTSKHIQSHCIEIRTEPFSLSSNSALALAQGLGQLAKAAGIKPLRCIYFSGIGSLHCDKNVKDPLGYAISQRWLDVSTATGCDLIVCSAAALRFGLDKNSLTADFTPGSHADFITLQKSTKVLCFSD